MPSKPKSKPPKDQLVFPNLLWQARKAAGFRTQEEFAKACNHHVETVGKYERGELAPNEDTVTDMINTLRSADPHANLAQLKRAAEQDRLTWVTWDMEPTDEPAARPELLAQSPKDQSGLLLAEKTDRYHKTYENWQQQEAGFDVLPSPSLLNLPFQRNPFFTGQEQLLEQLHHRLTPGSQVTLSQAISGLGGIGKTELALEYVYRYHKDYSKVLWVSASREALLSDLIFLMRDLGLELPSDKPNADGIVREVRYWLSRSRNWLLVLDNVDTLSLVASPSPSTSFIPPSHHGAVLLTTQLQVTEPVALTLQVNPMPEAEGAVLLLRRTKRALPDALREIVSADEQPPPVSEDELRDAQELSRALGGLPLALDQAGAYILETGSTLAHYLSLYKQRDAILLQKRGSVPSAHPESVTTTFVLAFERLQQKNAAAAELLRLCAFLGPDAIPEALIAEGDETHLGPVLASVVSDTIAFDGVIEALRSLSLIQRNASKEALITAGDETDLGSVLRSVARDTVAQHFEDFIQGPQGDETTILTFQREDIHRHASTHVLGVHRLVQAVLADQMSAAVKRDWIGRCIRLLDLAFPSKVSVWDTWFDTWLDRLEPHVLSIVSLKAAWEAAPTEAASLFENTARYLFLREREDEAESLYQYVLHIRQQTLGADHPDTVTALKNLWLLHHYHETGHPEYPF